MVPRGTTSQKLVQVQLTAVDNGFILNKVFVVLEAGKPPQQVPQSMVFLDAKEAWENVKSDLL